MMHRGLMFFFVIFLFVFPALAEAPLEISASNTLEWNRNARTYTAIGNVIAKRGNATVSSEKLTAFYDEKGGASEILRLSVEGDVVIASHPYKAYGDKGVYEVNSGDLMLTGENLRVETEAEYMTAKDHISFVGTANKMTAVGDAMAHKNENTLRAETLTAWFVKDAEGKLSTKKITADSFVTINTPTEKITAQRAIYNVIDQIAVLTGNVKIMQGRSFLEGARATVDMRTGVSRLFADGASSDVGTGSGRIKGVFYPKKQER